MRIKLDPADVAFSLYIRTRAGWKCEYCGVDYSDNHQGLHCSHYWGRDRQGTREEPDNSMALCYYHHTKLGHGDKEWRDIYDKIMLKKLGQLRMDTLEIQARTYCKKDRKMALIKAKELLKGLEAI